MQCQRCGKQVSVNDAFCTSCGSKIITPALYENRVTKDEYVMHPSKKMGTASKIVISLLIVVIMLLVGITFMLLSGYNIVPEKKDISTFNNAEEMPVEMTLEEKIDAYIETITQDENISVAVIDNKTKNLYKSKFSAKVYPAWGFYLPVYIAFCDNFSVGSDEYKNGIMSSDPGKCNSSANYAMELMGGTYNMTQYLQQEYGLESISYSRFFGQSADTSDNYTNAEEAAVLLNVLDKSGLKHKLSYNLSAFGISTPPNCQVYAQIGTENISVKNNLNLFAIVNGQNSDYSVVILTKNGVSAKDAVSKLLAYIHNEMECLK